MEKQTLPHQQRVVDEHAEMKERATKLSAFILDNPIFLEQPEIEQNDMQIQYAGMCVYIDALERRISRF